MTKFCKDCKFYNRYQGSRPWCTNPVLVEWVPPSQPDIVTGNSYEGYFFKTYCKSLREDETKCGLDAKAFVEKPKQETQSSEKKPSKKWFGLL